MYDELILVQHPDNPRQWLTGQEFFYWEGETLIGLPVGSEIDLNDIPAGFLSVLKISTAPVLKQDQNNPLQWILAEHFIFWEGNKLRLIPKGFVFDFASIPRLFWNIISPPELGDVPPLKHDWDYRNGNGPRSKRDKIFRDDMKADHIASWKVISAYYLVRACGWRSWNSGKIIIKEVPA